MARIPELIANGRTFSFELMPPRTPQRQAQLAEALQGLIPLKPSFVSITYGAGGSTRTTTHDLVVKLLREGNFNPMAHLTCAAHSRSELTDILKRYADEGLENVLALRGDPPLNGESELLDGELKTAAELVDLAREVADFAVAVAMHPEGHPKAPTVEADRRRQAAKLQRADFGITQFFFRCDDYVRFVEDINHLKVDKPIIPGILPPTNVNQLDKMAQMSGAEVPREVAERLHAVAGDVDQVRKVGVEIATELCAQLLAAGAPGLHFYTMNKSTATREIYANLGLTPARSAGDIV